MTDITSALNKIQTESVKYRSGLTEFLFTIMGGTANWLIDNAAFHLGDLIFSVLTLAQFQAVRNTTWVLPNGTSIVGSDLHALTGFTTAFEMRGEFIRILDNGRGVDSGRTMGSAQSEAFGSHTHTATLTLNKTLGGGGSTTGTWNQAATGGPPITATHIMDATAQPTLSGGTLTVASSGGAETRPRNIAVNVFLKINDD